MRPVLPLHKRIAVCIILAQPVTQGHKEQFILVGFRIGIQGSGPHRVLVRVKAQLLVLLGRLDGRQHNLPGARKEGSAARTCSAGGTRGLLCRAVSEDTKS